MMNEKDLIKKKLLIYGKGKIQKDFEFIFDKLGIIGYIDDNNGEAENIYNLSNVKELTYDLIIICDYDYQDKIKSLELLGLKYKENFIIADDLFESLDYPLIEKTINKDIYIWGTGKASIKYVNECNNLKIKAFLDNNIEKKGKFLNDIIIKYPDEISNVQWENSFVIIASTYYREIRNQLLQYGLEEGKDFVWDKRINPKPSELLKKTIYDKAYYDLECETMFNVYEVEQTGQVSCCCTTFVETRIGNLIYQEYEETWNSNLHKVLCLSLNNHTYSFCKKDMCPLLINREKMEQSKNKINEEYKAMKKQPSSLHISIDNTCNLYCASCRKEIEIAEGQELKDSYIMADKILDNAINKVDYISMAGNGEVFLSKVYEKMWSDPKCNAAKQFKILSNGMLFNENKWNKFIKKKNAEVYLCVSIDAATKETYEKIRRGGNFDVLTKNMEFAAKLREEGRLSYFQINFVVQRNNYKEMIDFIKWGQSLNVDKVFFTKILNWNTYSEEDFKTITMMRDDDNPNLELEKVLKEDIFKLPIVDVGTIKWKHNNSLPTQVTNFYNWEIQQWRK